MGPFSEKKESITYLNGKAVCFDHHLRICPICCLDMTFDEEFGDPGDATFDQEAENSDQVFVLSGETARLNPATDEQLVHFKDRMRNSKLGGTAGPSTAAVQLKLHSCQTCELTWLVGRDGKQNATNHPSHQTLFHEYSGTRRSLVVFTDGACPSNGTENARAGVGVFFAKNSQYNVSEILPGLNPPTSQKAEILAVVRALELIRERVVPARREFVQAAGLRQSESVIRDITHFRLIVATDSSYVVEALCANLLKWTKNRNGIFVNKQGKTVKNSEELTRLLDERAALAEVGVQVAFHLISREVNAEADELAKGALTEKTKMASPKVDKGGDIVFSGIMTIH